MNIKRLLSFAIMIVLTIGLSACSDFKAGRLSGDDEKIGEMRFQKIIDTLDKKDTEGLKKMFSPQALKEAKDIDGGIEYLMKFYKGNIKGKSVARQVSESNSHGEKASEMKCFYTVTTNDDTYIVFFIDQLVDTKNPDNLGLYMLQIIKESNEEKEFDWGNKTKCAGIYRPSATK